MPPRKRQRTTETISADLNAAFSRLAANQLHPDRLPTDTVYRAYGLSGPLDSSEAPDVLRRVCPARWNGRARATVTGSSSSSRPDSPALGKQESPDILVLDSADESIQDPDDSDQQTTPKKYGKGKSKIKRKLTKGSGAVKDKPCGPDACQNNPRCLNWLGQDQWEEGKAREEMRKAAGLPADPTNDRDPDKPVGLKNLGATCYANSFLQVWYRDTKFREGVYSCLPPSSGDVESSPVYQLQVLFAFLQNSQQAVYDPDPLVESLKIKRTEQQDAQEFSKLFLTLLDYEFKKQAKRAEVEGGNTRIGRIVEEQFEGKMTYGTGCLQCKNKSERTSSFLELEVNLTKQCRLEDRIHALFESERLDGDNQYLCEICDAKRDAVRYSYLTDLPPVLHFSILRFVFSQKDFSRSKSQHVVSYPLSLDMGQFLPKDARGQRPTGVWYDLRGVLMHKGQSAHHGHYVAQVHDESKGKWFLFDDETVVPIVDLNTPTTYDDDGEPVVAKKRLAAGFTRSKDGSIRPKSKDAYMLVYARRGDAAPTTDISDDKHDASEPLPPPLAQSTVEQLDATYRAKVEAFQARAAEVEARFEAVREKKRSVYQVWDVEGDDEEAVLVDQMELRRWLEDELKTRKPVADSTDVTCAGKDRLEGGDSYGNDVKMVDNADADEQKVTSIKDGEGGGMSDDCDAPGTPAEPGQAVKSLSTPIPPQEKGKSRDLEADVAAELPHQNTPGGSTASLESRQCDAERITTLSNALVVCEHGMADPKQAERLKRVSQRGVKALRDSGVSIEPELVIPRSLCRQCVGGLAADYLYSIEHPEQVKEFDEANYEPGVNADSFLLSKAWLANWRRANPKMHFQGALADPSPSDEPYCADIVCPHGGRQPEAKRRVVVSSEGVAVLKRVFPEWEPIDPEPCCICEDQHLADSDNVEVLKKQLAIEKKQLKALLSSGQMKLTGSRLPIGDAPGYSNIIPKEWLRQWLNWTRSQGRQGLRPGQLDNSRFICQHGLLCLDVPLEVETSRSIDIVGPKEWAALEQHYDAGPRISIHSTVRNSAAPASVPPVCQDCLEESRKQFSTAELRVVRLYDSDFDEEGNRRPPAADPSETGTKMVTLPQRSMQGERMSSRIANKGNVAFARSSRFINMHKGDLVKDLKLKIQQETSIPVAAMRLFYKQQELDHASASVDALGIAAGDTIEVYGVDTNIDLDKLNDDPDQSRSGALRGGKRKREEGFGGTGLSGFNFLLEGVDEADAEAIRQAIAEDTDGPAGNGMNPSDSPVGMEEREVVRCPACTFENAAGVAACEMCETALTG